MPLIPALQAFLEALDGSRTPAGHAAAPPREPVQQPPERLDRVVAALAVELEQLKASVDGLKGYVKDEVDRGVRASEAARRAAQRVAARLEAGLADADAEPAGEGVRDADGEGGERRWVPPMPAVVAPPEQPRFSLEDHFALARARAAHMD